MQDVSDKLLGQFVACLEERFVAGDAGAEEAATADARSGDDVQDAVSTPTPGAVAAPAAAAASGTNGAPATTSARVHPSPSAGAANARTTRRGGVSGARKADPSDSLNLGATVLPVLLKSYWKQAAAALVALFGLQRLRARRKRRRTPDDV
jgi:hypothetical protein